VPQLFPDLNSSTRCLLRLVCFSGGSWAAPEFTVKPTGAVGPSVVAIHWTRSARGDIYLIAFFRTVSSITLPFASSIQAL
jgi:hypothetical protein